MYMSKATKKYKWVDEVNLKPKALWQFKVNSVLQFDA